MAKKKPSKPFRNYKFQVINFTDKEIIYTDNKGKYLMSIGKTLEINDIIFRKRITSQFKDFKIKTDDKTD